MKPRPLPEPEDDHDRAILDMIARVGWAVIGIEEEPDMPFYGFSVGLYHTHGLPELIVFGQKHEIAQGVINNAAREMIDGRTFTPGERIEGLLEGYPAVVAPVDPRHYRGFVGYARWLNRGDAFPLQQIVWPDRDGRFPWDDGYPPALFYLQRLLGSVERWPHGWPFPDPPNVITFTSRPVMAQEKPILHAARDSDGAWQFHTGEPVDLKDAMVVALEEVVKLDPTLTELGNLERGTQATRTAVGAEWERTNGGG
ncbi:MAG: DUF4262 domain-containing protein [Gemmataceae bacterium]|nr:DUF4262 domain-containing protein [Gemmataceae bacterium]